MTKKQELKGTTEEREQFMKSVFETFYKDAANAGKDLSVNKANETFKAKYGTMLRNKKAYEIRDAVKAALGLTKKRGKKGAGTTVVTQAARPSQLDDTAQVAAQRGACLINGTPEQLGWLKSQVVPALTNAGMLDGIKVDYETPKYVVLARS